MLNLTDRIFWIKYWESRTDIYQEVLPNGVFNELIDDIAASATIATSVELGGFPGYYSIYLSKFHKVKCTIIDYVIIKPITKKLFKINGLKSDAIDIFEGDLFCITPKEKYDLVFSNGFLEHFDNTELVLKKHVEFVKKGGSILVSLPNFMGLNGWFQKTFDFENYICHNLNCMDINYLLTICNNIGLDKIKVYYYGKFDLWLENKDRTSKLGKVLARLIYWVGKKIFTLLSFESRMFSPYIVITARLPEFENTSTDSELT